MNDIGYYLRERVHGKTYGIDELWLMWFSHTDELDDTQYTPFMFFLFILYLIGNEYCLYDKKRIKLADLHLYGDKDDYIYETDNCKIPPHIIDILNIPEKYESMVYVLEYLDTYDNLDIEKIKVSTLRSMKNDVMRISEISYNKQNEVFRKYQSIFNTEWERLGEFWII